jgi:hypothetical protein
MTNTKLTAALTAAALATPAMAQPCPQDSPNAPLALHEEWIMQGWERRDGDPAFVFTEKMGKYYDLDSPAGVFWDNFAPGETQLFSDALVYGLNWEGLQNASRSILHGMSDGHAILLGDDVASTAVGFVGRIERLNGEILAFDARSQLGWQCVDGIWKIKQELNYAWLVEPQSIEARLGTLLATMAETETPHPYVGMWVTADGRIRHELLANGRYDEARGTRESAYQGRYEIEGNHIQYWDDTGFTADGDFIDGVLHHAGMVLFRRE